jgi:hypothetical protein
VPVHCSFRIRTAHVRCRTHKCFGSRQYVAQAHCSLCVANAPDSLCGPSARGHISNFGMKPLRGWIRPDKTSSVAAHRVIVLGSVWAELIRRKAPAATNHIVILPPATPVPAPKRYQRVNNKRVRIAFMGPLGNRKGLPQLIAALGRLADESS